MSYPERIESWTADEVAECLPYQKFLSEQHSRALYIKLWEFVNEANASNNATPLGGDGTGGTVETPEERTDPKNSDKVPHWWGKLEKFEQKALEQAVELEFK